MRSLSAVQSGATAVSDFTGTGLMFSIRDHLAGHTGSQPVVRVSTNNQKTAGSYPWARADATQALFLDTGQLCNRAISMCYGISCVEPNKSNLKQDGQPTEKCSELYSLNILEAK